MRARTDRWTRWPLLLAAALLLGVVPAAGAADPPGEAAASPESPDGEAPKRNPKAQPKPPFPLVSIRAPEFEVYTLEREPVHLSDHRGKVVLINFWGIWCPPCRYEIPELKQLYAELQPHGFEILGINSGDPWRRVPTYVEEAKINYPILYDNGVVQEYGVEAFPTNLVVDQKGFIRYSVEGYDPGAVERIRAVARYLLEHP